MFGCLIEKDIDIDIDPNNKQLFISIPIIFGQMDEKSNTLKDKQTKNKNYKQTKRQTFKN